MHTHLRPDVLRLVCAELPSADANRVRNLPAADLSTHLDAYSVLRRLRIPLPRELEDEFLRCILEQMTCRDPECRAGAGEPVWFQDAAAGRPRRTISGPSPSASPAAVAS